MATPEINWGEGTEPPAEPERRLRLVSGEAPVEPDVFSRKLGREMLRALRDEAPSQHYRYSGSESPDQ